MLKKKYNKRKNIKESNFFDQISYENNNESLKNEENNHEKKIFNINQNFIMNNVNKEDMNYNQQQNKESSVFINNISYENHFLSVNEEISKYSNRFPLKESNSSNISIPENILIQQNKSIINNIDYQQQHSLQNSINTHETFIPNENNFLNYNNSLLNYQNNK